MQCVSLSTSCGLASGKCGVEINRRAVPGFRGSGNPEFRVTLIAPATTTDNCPTSTAEIASFAAHFWVLLDQPNVT